VKLVKDERESTAARSFVAEFVLISSELVVTEVPRALRGTGEAESDLDLAQSLRDDRARPPTDLGLHDL
jgi:hypothetical protein